MGEEVLAHLGVGEGEVDGGDFVVGVDLQGFVDGALGEEAAGGVDDVHEVFPLVAGGGDAACEASAVEEGGEGGEVGHLGWGSAFRVEEFGFHGAAGSVIRAA